MRHIHLIFLSLTIFYSCSTSVPTNKNIEFVRVENGKFMLGNSPYFYMGANYWYAANLGAPKTGNRKRLVRELDKLKTLGVRNFRIQIASEGGSEIKYGVNPSLQPQLGIFNEDIFRGIDFLLAELEERQMHVVLVLNNYWPWTGGMAKYLQWNGGGEIPYPSAAKPGSWGKYMKYTDVFYQDSASLKSFRNTIRKIIGRTNTITGRKYKDEPAIMAWQLANEPRGGSSVEQRMAFVNWIGETADFIKTIDTNHLVTTGSEGKVGHHKLMEDYEKANAFSSIDYLCVHMWPQNWGWFDPAHPTTTYTETIAKANNYIEEHLVIARKLKKPVVIEEFGLARDEAKFGNDAPSVWREKFYQWMFKRVYEMAAAGEPIAGTNFWGWSGEGRPRVAGAMWQTGDPLIGDPPHEAQGWYAVYDTDSAMMNIIRKNAKAINSL